MRVLGRGSALVALVLCFVVVPAAVASADPAGPTDFRTDIERIEPASDTFEVRMIGGDSFLELRARPGAEIIVVGYQGEPFLRFDRNGVVSENTRSPSTYLSEDRFGAASLPPEADPEAEPDWSEVAAGGRYAWHDHRTHWMNPQDPPGKGPGDQILEAVVPLIIDGEEVRITVASYWEASRSPVPAVLATAAAVGAVALLSAATSARTATMAAMSGGGVLGVAAGLWAYLSVPGETGPSLVGWALPATAVATAGAALWFARSPATRPVADLALGVATVELLVWGWLRRDWLVRSIVPTSAPGWLDLALTAATIGLAAAGGVALSFVVARYVVARGSGRRIVAHDDVDH